MREQFHLGGSVFIWFQRQMTIFHEKRKIRLSFKEEVLKQWLMLVFRLGNRYSIISFGIVESSHRKHGCMLHLSSEHITTIQIHLPVDLLGRQRRIRVGHKEVRIMLQTRKHKENADCARNATLQNHFRTPREGLCRSFNLLPDSKISLRISFLKYNSPAVFINLCLDQFSIFTKDALA